MEEIDHKTLSVNGLNMHVAELGRGPIILFLHGFPECWYTWRHQITHLAARGYRAVAPDLRGYGDTAGAPADDPSRFTTLHAVGDLVALIDAVAPPDDRRVFVVGHDWGATIALGLCLYRPDKVKALVNLSVAFSRRNPSRKPIETLRGVYGDDYYICRFQEPGEIEHEFAQIGVKNVLKHFLTYRNPGPLYLPKNKPFPDTPISLPSWCRQVRGHRLLRRFELLSSPRLELGVDGALDWVSDKSTRKIHGWRSRPNLQRPGNEGLHRERWVQERCALVKGGGCDERGGSFYPPRKAS